MSKRLNAKFLTEYIKLDGASSQLFGIRSGGVSEYITRLGGLSSSAKGKELLTRLVRYRGYRNKLAHEIGALENFSSILPSDIKWMRSFSRLVKERRDYLSLYKKKEERKEAWKRFKRWAVISFFLATAVLLAVLLFICFLK